MCVRVQMCVCVLRVCMWWKRRSGVSHGGSEFSRPAAQLSSCASSGEAPAFMGKSPLRFGSAFPGSHSEQLPQSADGAGDVSCHTPRNASELRHNMKSDHATGIISPLSVPLFKYTKQLLLRTPAIWGSVGVNTRQEFCSLILPMSCAFTPI